MGAGCKVESGTNGIYLADSMKLKVLMTLIPCAPNDKSQFQKYAIAPNKIDKIMRKELNLKAGEGPELDVFIPPGELTARFSWENDNLALETLKKIMGFTDNNQGNKKQKSKQQEETEDLPGFIFANKEREIKAHVQAVAAELYNDFVDAYQGRVVTEAFPEKIKLVGNLDFVSINVASAPVSKVIITHSAPGKQRRISRFALLPETARHLILGILPFKKEGKQ